MFTEIAENIECSLKNYEPFHKASDRAAYEALPETVTKRFLGLAEKNTGFVFNGIPIFNFMEFSKTGNRSHFEALNFSKRHALNSLIMGECIEHTGKYMTDILNGIYSICEESAWQLPAHNSYERGGQNYSLPDVTDPVLDLFACETGALLATASYLLHDEFDEISPFINKMIRHALCERIYKPYMNRHFWWMGNGDEPMCNWTVWCTQNILLSVFLNPATDEELRKATIKKAAYSIDCFLKDYGSDGCCDEGALYYGHSALCLYHCIEILNAVTGNAFASVYSEEKIKNIASYIFRVNISGKYYFNFADCSAVIDRTGAREFLFAKAIGNTEMMRFAAKDYKEDDHVKNENEINLFYQLEELFTAGEMLDFDTDSPVVHSDFYYSSVGLFIAHDSQMSLAVKAGDNDDSHNHNDTGSVIVYKNGLPVLIDVGVETYTAKTFSKDRYSIWTMQSAYHNLPTINDRMQEAGAKYKATDVEYFLSQGVSDIKMDIASAYPKEAKVASYKRHVSFYKNSQIVISDEVSFKSGDMSDNSYFLSFMTYEKPVISGNRIIVGNARLEFVGDALLSYETIPVTDERLKWAWKHDIYRILVSPKTEKLMIVIS